MAHNNTDQAAFTVLPEWDEERLLFCSDEWFKSLLDDIDNAQQSIQLQTYIFEMDTVGWPVLRRLCAAAARGVDVQVIVDGIGSFSAVKIIQQELRKYNAQLSIYHPLPWCLSTRQFRGSAWISHFIARWTSVNKRQHSKLCLIDKKAAWVGSFNISQKHLFRLDANDNWTDAVARVSGKRCILLDEFFSAVWDRNIQKLSALFLRYPITNYSRALRKKRLQNLLDSMASAKKRIWIENAYFSPTDELVRALTKAAARGIDVRIIASKKSDVPFFPALSITYYMDLLSAGVHIHAYNQGILHTKYMVIDNRVTIGSSNMNHRSLLHDVELDIHLFKPTSRKSLETHFRSMADNSHEITQQSITDRYARLLLIGQIPRLLRYWL